MVEGSNPSGPASSTSDFTPSSLDTEIVNYELWLARNGHSSETVKERTKKLRMLARRVGTLIDGEALKDYVAKSNIEATLEGEYSQPTSLTASSKVSSSSFQRLR